MGKSEPMSQSTPMSRTVTAHIDLDVLQPGPGRSSSRSPSSKSSGLAIDETLELTLDGKSVPVHEVIGVTGSRFHVVEPEQAGKLLLSYEASVVGRADKPLVDEFDLIQYRRPSRYAESDKLAAVAQREFGELDRPAGPAGRGGQVGGRTPELRLRQQRPDRRLR